MAGSDADVTHLAAAQAENSLAAITVRQNQTKWGVKDIALFVDALRMKGAQSINPFVFFLKTLRFIGTMLKSNKRKMFKGTGGIKMIRDRGSRTDFDTADVLSDP